MTLESAKLREILAFNGLTIRNFQDTLVKTALVNLELLSMSTMLKISFVAQEIHAILTTLSTLTRKYLKALVLYS